MMDMPWVDAFNLKEMTPHVLVVDVVPLYNSIGSPGFIGGF